MFADIGGISSVLGLFSNLLGDQQNLQFVRETQKRMDELADEGIGFLGDYESQLGGASSRMRGNIPSARLGGATTGSGANTLDLDKYFNTAERFPAFTANELNKIGSSSAARTGQATAGAISRGINGGMGMEDISGQLDMLRESEGQARAGAGAGVSAEAEKARASLQIQEKMAGMQSFSTIMGQNMSFEEWLQGMMGQVAGQKANIKSQQQQLLPQSQGLYNAANMFGEIGQARSMPQAAKPSPFNFGATFGI